MLVCWLLIAAGVLEAVWGLLQMYGYVPSGMSRSAWLATLVASGYVLAVHHRGKLNRYKKVLVLGGLFLTVSAIGAYHWKKDSADGRLLMWKVAAQAVIVRPFHPSVAEPYLSLLLVGEAVFGAS